MVRIFSMLQVEKWVHKWMCFWVVYDKYVMVKLDIGLHFKITCARKMCVPNYWSVPLIFLVIPLKDGVLSTDSAVNALRYICVIFILYIEQLHFMYIAIDRKTKQMPNQLVKMKPAEQSAYRRGVGNDILKKTCECRKIGWRKKVVRINAYPSVVKTASWLMGCGMCVRVFNGRISGQPHRHDAYLSIVSNLSETRTGG